MVLLGRAFTADRTHGKFLIKFQADDIGTLKTPLRAMYIFFSFANTPIYADTNSGGRCSKIRFQKLPKSVESSLLNKQMRFAVI